MLPEIAQFLREPTKDRMDTITRYLFEITDKVVGLNMEKGVHHLEEGLGNHEKLEQIGRYLDHLIGEPVYKERLREVSI